MARLPVTLKKAHLQQTRENNWGNMFLLEEFTGNSLKTLDSFAQQDGQKDMVIYVKCHMMLFFCLFVQACKVNKAVPVLFVHTPPFLNYISLAHGLKFCKAFLKILLMVAILCQKVHLACKFKHGLQIFKS